MNARRQSGFTLIELVVAMALLGAMLVVLYSGLAFALKSWDTADVSGRRTADRRIGDNFLRRELSELFPMRWKDPMTMRLAFEGKKESLRFVSARPAGISAGGLSLVGVAVEAGDTPRQHNLVMRRASPDDSAQDFGPLDQAKPTILLADIDNVEFSYLGSENDFTDPAWLDTWPYPGRVPQLIRMRVATSNGTAIPEMVVRVMLGEEAGCLENFFQRVCSPRGGST